VLRAGWESFVGAGPLPMRNGLTLGELGLWFVSDSPRAARLPLEGEGRTFGVAGSHQSPRKTYGP